MPVLLAHGMPGPLQHQITVISQGSMSLNRSSSDLCKRLSVNTTVVTSGLTLHNYKLRKGLGFKSELHKNKTFRISIWFVPLHHSLFNLIGCMSSYQGKRKKAGGDRQLYSRVWMNHLCNFFKAEATFIPRNWQHTLSDVPDY